MTGGGRRFIVELRELPWAGIHQVPVDVRLRQALKTLLRTYRLGAGDVREIKPHRNSAWRDETLRELMHRIREYLHAPDAGKLAAVGECIEWYAKVVSTPATVGGSEV